MSARLLVGSPERLSPFQERRNSGIGPIANLPILPDQPSVEPAGALFPVSYMAQALLLFARHQPNEHCVRHLRMGNVPQIANGIR